jgi:putative ABC transport system permease protein
MDMIRNFILSYVRSIRKNPIYTFINVLGLSIGLAISLLIFLYVNHDLSYDKHHENAERIYRVSREFFNPTGESNLHLGHLAPPFSVHLKSYFNQIEEAVRLLNPTVDLVTEDRNFRESAFFFADPDVFKVFSWKLIKGDPDKALRFADGLVLSEKTAKKYFGEQDPIGKSMILKVAGLSWDMVVRGVMEDHPDNTHIAVDILASFNPVIEFYGSEEAMMSNFGNNSFATYLLLEKGSDYRQMEALFPEFLDQHMPPGSNFKASQLNKLHLWPITRIHLYSNLDSEVQVNGSIDRVYIYSGIALFILFIACINFMNLSTAGASKRAMEVGLRKMMGADKKSLILQFMSETLFTVAISLGFAVLLVLLFLPEFSSFSEKALSFNMIENPRFLLLLGGLLLLVGVLAGSYPSLFLSAFQPVKTIKGSFKSGPSHKHFRSVLVISQFVISISLIVGVLVVVAQLKFMQTKDLGFEKDNVVVLPAYNEMVSNWELYRERLLSHRGIQNMALASRVPSGRLLDGSGASAEINGEMVQISARIADIHVSHDFFKTLGINVLAGRDFDIHHAADSTEAMILNKSAIRAIGWLSAEEAIGKAFNYGQRRGYLIGVVQDFHFESLHQPIAPIVFLIPSNRFNNLAVKVNAGYEEEVLSFLKDEWIALRPDNEFSYFMIDEAFNKQYDAEQKGGVIFSFFAALAIFISIIGLFGLVTFAGDQRRRELGIRKVFGASIPNLILLFSRDYLKLVFIAFCLSIPLSWFAMSSWLENFSYHINLNWSFFISAGALALLVAAITISIQSIKSALNNPSQVLKDN